MALSESSVAAKQATSRPSRWWKWVLGGIVLWIVFWSIPFEYTRTKPLGPNFKLVERTHVDRRPYSGIVESTGSFFLPFPMSDSYVKWRKVMAGKEEIARARSDEALTPSPDGRHLLIWSVVPESGPWRLISMDGPRVDTLALRFLDHDPAPVPYILVWRVFRQWSSDSRYARLTLEGEGDRPIGMEDSAAVHGRYMEVWVVDTKDGSARREVRCESKTPGENEYGGTPCQSIKAWYGYYYDIDKASPPHTPDAMQPNAPPRGGD